MIKFDDGITTVLKASDITHEETGSNGMEYNFNVGERCIAPYGKEIYPAEVCFISGKKLADGTKLHVVEFTHYPCH